MVINPLKDESIDKRSPVPLYYQIMRQLLEKINGGEFAADSALPPERELAETCKVSRMTARQAVADEEPMALETATLPAALYPGLSRHDLEDRSLYQLLTERWGIRLDCAAAYEAPLLRVEAGTPLLLMHRITYNQNGRAVEHVKSLYRGDRYKFIIELRQKSGAFKGV